MVEWFKALVLKTIVFQYTVGSNPTLSEFISFTICWSYYVYKILFSLHSKIKAKYKNWTQIWILVSNLTKFFQPIY